MRFSELLNGMPDFKIYVDFYGSMKTITDFGGPNPPEGYGPFYAGELNYLSQRYPEQYDPHEAINNADCYPSYELSTFWTWRCERQFGPCLTSAQNIQRTPDPRPAVAGQLPLAERYELWNSSVEDT